MKKSLLLIALAAAGVHSSAYAVGERLGRPAPESINAPAGAGIVADPSFEDGTPNSFWTEASTNFGTPLCTVAACGSGTSAQPVRTGTWWAWFGGAAGTETGSMSQSISIPANSNATLDFGFQAPVCVTASGANSFIEARINGTSVWRADATNALCNVTTGYALQSVNISQYAGQTVTLSFDSTTTGGVTNFFVDDVQVTATAIPVSAPTMSAFGLGALALLLGVVGVLAVRRFS